MLAQRRTIGERAHEDVSLLVRDEPAYKENCLSFADGRASTPLNSSGSMPTSGNSSPLTVPAGRGHGSCAGTLQATAALFP